MPYLAEKLDENEGDNNAPSGGGARRIVAMAGGICRADSSMSDPLTLREAADPTPHSTPGGLW